MEKRKTIDSRQTGKSPPEHIGPYQVLSVLGKGGMGVVYLGSDTRLKRLVAIKMLPEDLAQDADRRSRFLREARILASLSHPNIAAIYDLEESQDGHVFLILEKVEGISLMEELCNGPLPVKRTLIIGKQISSALEAAHNEGVIHRDLKPANIMLTPQGQVKVIDFGLARQTTLPAEHLDGIEGMGGQAESAKTRAGVVMGTPGYMSPEQVRSLPHDKRTDIFAFGCVLFECLTGQRAFTGNNTADAILSVLTSTPNWSDLPKDTPASIRELLIGCLQKEIPDRLSDFFQARTRIENALMVLDTSVSQITEIEEQSSNNLPSFRTSFVGRETEILECLRILDQSQMLTLTGTGGAGKTRLSIKLAETMIGQYPDGVWFIDLSSARDQRGIELIAGSVLGIHKKEGKPFTQELIDNIGQNRVFIILDNCEHLIKACSEFAATLLASCPGVKILATSREALRIPEERTREVSSLSFPASTASHTAQLVANYEAIRLFVDRATIGQPDFILTDGNASVVASICQELDGIPLAIELAAARVPVLSVEQIKSMLRDRFRLLRSQDTMMPRRQTLWATVEWSYDRLGPDEQEVFGKLSAFAGGWTLDAATHMVGDEFEVLELITSLVNKSLVEVRPPVLGETRYDFLVTIRQFALEKLKESREEPATRDLHLDYFLGLAEESEPKLLGPGQPESIRRLLADQENLLTALGWCEVAEDGAEKALRLTGAVWRYWNATGQFGLARHTIARALARKTKAQPSAARARVLAGAGLLALQQGDAKAARAHYEESLAISRRLEDKSQSAAALNGLGAVASDGEEDYEVSRSLFVESLQLYREIKDEVGIARELNNLGRIEMRARNFERSRKFFQESLSVRRDLGDEQGMASTLTNLASLSTKLGDPRATHAYLIEGLRSVKQLDLKGTGASILEAVAALATSLSEFKRAAQLYGAAETVREEIGMPILHDEWVELEPDVEKVRRELGPELSKREWEVGLALPFDGAVDYAIAWLEEQHGLGGAPALSPPLDRD